MEMRCGGRGPQKGMIIMGHGVLSECLVTLAGDATRLQRMLRLSVYAIATAILLPVKTGER